MTRERIGATLILDPHRVGEQLKFIRPRAEVVRAFGDRVWTNITPEQAERFREEGIAVQFHEEAYLVDLPAVLFDPLDGGDPRPPAELAAAPTPGEPAHYIVQFVAPPEPDWIGALEELGAVYAGDLPQLAALFRMTPEQAEQARALEEVVRWLGVYHPVYALDYRLAGRDVPFSAADLPTAQLDPSKFVEGDRLAVQVSFFDGLTTGEAAPLVEAAGAADVTDTDSNVVASINPEDLQRLLSLPNVRAVEPYREPLPTLQRAGILIGANQVRNLNQVDFLVNLDGTGEIVGVLDTGLSDGKVPPAHVDFNDALGVSRVISIDNVNAAGRPTADHYPHGTHVVGCIAGSGAAAVAAGSRTVPRGIAPGAEIVFHSVNLAAPAANKSPNALSYRRYLDALKAAYRAGARVHSNSWSGPNKNVYTRGKSEVIDAFAYTHPDLLLLFAAGNDEDDVNGNGILDMSFLGETSVAKNILSIGACENETSVDGEDRNYVSVFGICKHKDFKALANSAAKFSMSDSADDIVLFSNRGRVAPAPLGTGRVRPDLVAPGTNIMSTRPPAANKLEDPITGWHDPKTAPVADYYVEHGTSMATPIAAGAALLVRQFYRQRLSRLRRPQLVASLAEVPAPPPLPAPPPPDPLAFIDRPAAARTDAGCFFAWVRHATAGATQNNIEAARFDRRLFPTGKVEELFRDVGDHPAPSAAAAGDQTFVVHRGKDAKVNLSLFDKNLKPVAAFNTNGTLTLMPESRTEDDRRPAVCAQADEVAVAWVKKDSDELVFQHFEAATGAKRDLNPKTLGHATNTSPHPYLVHTGARYAAFWVREDAGQYALLMRTVDAAGKVEGDKPAELVAPQATQLREAHAVWDAREKQFVVTWVEVGGAGACKLRVLRAREDGTAAAAPETVIDPAAETIPPPKQDLRGPRLALHPEKGYVLVYEDNRSETYDLHLCFLDREGKLDTTRFLPDNYLQLSDTPSDTAGFSAFADAEGVTPLWQSKDEVNSDLFGVYALNVTGEGAFEAQADPNTPLLRDGRYVAHMLSEHGDPAHKQLAAAWAGGEQYTLRAVPDGAGAKLELVRANADGKTEANGVSTVHRAADGYNSCSLLWTGREMLAACSTPFASHVIMLDGEGHEVQSFGPLGADINEAPDPRVHIQTAQAGSKKDWRAYVAYGTKGQGGGSVGLRLAVLNDEGKTPGADVPAPVDFLRGKSPVLAHGTARHGWFHVVPTDTPVHLIAAWHRGEEDGKLFVELNRFRLDGRPQSGTPNPVMLTKLAGDSCNAVVAPRPALYDLTPPLPADAAARSRQRVFGVAWQNRPDNTSPWEIRFSGLKRDGKVDKTQDVRVIQKAGLNCTDPQLVWHTDGYGLAWLQQDAADATKPRRLFFTVIDEQGARVNLPPAVGETQLSADAADVQSFQLVWNGRGFRVSWSEAADGKLRHRQTALAVPRLRGGAPFDEPFKQPSAALVRATLINGATNIRNRALPSLGTDPNDGYGWGRINLRQSLAPVPPVTFHARDDAAVESGRTARYQFRLPAKTTLLRVTLAWTDPPHRSVVNNLNLRMTAPSGALRVYVGNRWQTGAVVGSPPVSGPLFSDPLPANPDPKLDPFDKVYTVEQIVIHEPPEGDYLVEVLGGAFKESMYMQHPGQPFSLLFVGSGAEIRTAKKLTPAPQAIY